MNDKELFALATAPSAGEIEALRAEKSKLAMDLLSMEGQADALEVENQRLRAELAALREQEPVAECKLDKWGDGVYYITMAEKAPIGLLYAAPVPASTKSTPAIRDALRTGSKRDYPSDELCDIRWAAALAAAKGEK